MSYEVQGRCINPHCRTITDAVAIGEYEGDCEIIEAAIAVAYAIRSLRSIPFVTDKLATLEAIVAEYDDDRQIVKATVREATRSQPAEYEIEPVCEVCGSTDTTEMERC